MTEKFEWIKEWDLNQDKKGMAQVKFLWESLVQKPYSDPQNWIDIKYDDNFVIVTWNKNIVNWIDLSWIKL